jgi:adenylate cyclase
MSGDEGERKLAAILSADVAGYSRLMQDDERATVRTLTEYRQVFFDHVARHRGRVVDAPGDNLLAEFASPVEAVAAASEVQAELARRNGGLPEHRRMHFRIGINLGDVLEKDGALYGDGVNVAARLESLAEPGGLLISEAVHMQVEGKLHAAFAFIGEQQVKNIAKPVRAWRVEARAARDAAPAPLPITDMPSVAVLPFENMSGDPEQGYFSDGIAEDIITELSKLSGLFVIARNSSFATKGRTVAIHEVSRELGVRYVLEGSVRKAGNRVRITAQLIDGTSGGHLWAERYDRDLTDVFAVQDEVTREIVGGLQSARELLERAVELDPGFGRAHTALAQNSLIQVEFGLGERERLLRRAREEADRAVELDPLDPFAHCAVAKFCFFTGDLDRFQIEAREATRLGPNAANMLADLARFIAYGLGDPGKGAEMARHAMRLNPHYPPWYRWPLVHEAFFSGRYETAIDELNLTEEPQLWREVFLAIAHAQLGRAEEANRHVRRVMTIMPEYTYRKGRGMLQPHESLSGLFRDGHVKAGLPLGDQD